MNAASISNGTHLSSTKKAASAFLSENRKPKERLAHLIPMVGISFCLMLLLRERKRGILISMGSTLLAAGLIFLSIEGLQELLPTSFAHGFALSDIWTSLVGGLTGSVAAVLRMSRTRNLGVKF